MLDLVIPDTGPLITFGVIDRLDLLDRFNCAILVTDMVEAEIRRGPDTAKDKPILERWLASRGNRVQTFQTSYGIMWKMLSPEQQKTVKRQVPDAGEQSIREFIQKVEGTISDDDQMLVLFEEDAVKKVQFGPKVHLLHSFAFMVTLQEMGLISSADQMRDDVLAAGRLLARDTFERRAVGTDGAAVDWQIDYNIGATDVRSLQDAEPKPGDDDDGSGGGASGGPGGGPK